MYIMSNHTSFLPLCSARTMYIEIHGFPHLLGVQKFDQNPTRRETIEFVESFVLW